MFNWAKKLLHSTILVFWGDCSIVFGALCQVVLRKEADICYTAMRHLVDRRSSPILIQNPNPISSKSQCLYLPDLAPYDFYPIVRLHLPIKFMGYADILAFQKACTDIRRAMPANGLKSSFEKLLSRQISESKRQETILSKIKQFWRGNQLLFDFEKVLFTLKKILNIYSVELLVANGLSFKKPERYIFCPFCKRHLCTADHCVLALCITEMIKQNASLTILSLLTFTMTIFIFLLISFISNWF